ncbi:MAG: serine/threonine protein kinase [Polyangiaceae bacterium]|nr:serine/threonine protein kinase [Polyangiaceae bacterium]
MTAEDRGGTLRLESGRFVDATTIVAKASGDSEPQVVDPSPVSFEPGTRYATRRVLGAGGMGEVRLCGDAWVGREVAMKVMRAGAGSERAARARFLREARVQGQLEHPSVVPVYDLGHDESGQEFFTMKRVKGQTLEEILTALRAGDAAAEQKFGRRRLLSAMSQVCLAVAYAHSRGVIHRDLKPANIMLGDFGEVYVLDWGIARIHGAADLDEHERVVPDTEAVPETQVGSLVGTPGYMSPEQARGETRELTPRSDVYALGTILFELLSLEPLHRGKSVNALLASTLTQAPVAPSSWAKDRGIAPELDEVCVRATALDPTDRFESARALSESLERYLDGERDAERRTELAMEHLARAREALERSDDAERRSEGLRELSRALALNPADPAAIGMVSSWVLSATDALPAEAEAELKAVELADRKSAVGRAAAVYFSWIAFVPVLMLTGVKSWALVGAFAAITAVLIANTTWMALTGKSGPKYMRRNLWLNFTAVGATSFVFGPFILTPGMAIASAAAFVVGIRANRQTRWLVAALGFAAVFVPAILGWVGLLPAPYAFEDGVMKVLPQMVPFHPGAAQALLVAVTLAQLITPSIMVGRSLEALTRAERQNFAQAWRLRQLVPAAPTATSIPPEAKCVF